MVNPLELVLKEFNHELYEENFILETTNKYQVVHRIDKTLNNILLENNLTNVIQYTISDPDNELVWYNGEYLKDNEKISYILVEFIDQIHLIKDVMLIKIRKDDKDNG